MNRHSQIIKQEIGGVKFSWDDTKARLNMRNHGVAFEEAASCWLDPFKLETDDLKHSDDESRWLLTGTSHLNRLLICWFTERKIQQEEVIRIIGAREANPSEREHYEEIPR